MTFLILFPALLRVYIQNEQDSVAHCEHLEQHLQLFERHIDQLEGRLQELEHFLNSLANQA